MNFGQYVSHYEAFCSYDNSTEDLKVFERGCLHYFKIETNMEPRKKIRCSNCNRYMVVKPVYFSFTK